MDTISPEDLQRWLDDGGRAAPLLLDVRDPREFELCHIEGSRHIPMQQVPQRLSELAADAEIVVVCHHGVRSAQVAQYLARNGFRNVRNLQGGISAWSERIDPSMPRY